LLKINRNFTHCPIVEYRGPAGGELDKPFSRVFFQASAVIGRQVKELIYWGAARRKIARKKPTLPAKGPSAETILLRSGQGVGLILLHRESKRLRRYSFCRDNQKIVKVKLLKKGIQAKIMRNVDKKTQKLLPRRHGNLKFFYFLTYSTEFYFILQYAKLLI
jgi:hypothetical protein